MSLAMAFSPAMLGTCLSAVFPQTLSQMDRVQCSMPFSTRVMPHKEMEFGQMSKCLFLEMEF
jgi:hypothetical protein